MEILLLAISKQHQFNTHRALYHATDMGFFLQTNENRMLHERFPAQVILKL